MNANSPHSTSVYAPSSPPRPTSGYAIISLVCGILGWILFPLIGSLAAIIFGHMARAEISREPDKDGDGMAVAGLILGYLSLLISVVAIIFLVLFLLGGLGFLAMMA